MKMHRFPKLFSHRRPDSSSSRRPAKPRRLERSNALRNVTYEFSPSTSSSSSPEESQRASSLDSYAANTTSFRVDGTEGGFEAICEAFGFSGIDDFAISPEEYEAMKVGSSSSSSSSSSGKKLEPLCREIEVDCDDVVQYSYGSGYIGALDVIHRRMEGLCVGNLDNSYGKKLGESGVSKRLEDGVNYSDKVRVRSKAARINGIKGARPTIVVPDWDTKAGFLRESDPCIPKFQSRFFSNNRETEEVGRDRTEQEKGARIGGLTIEENRALSESCSFSSNEDDSSSSMTEPLSSISSHDRYGHVIHDWQKGELLGRGTFGSVYEGIAE